MEMYFISCEPTVSAGKTFYPFSNIKIRQLRHISESHSKCKSNSVVSVGNLGGGGGKGRLFIYHVLPN